MTEPAWMPASAGMTNYGTVSKGGGLALWSKFNYSTGQRRGWFLLVAALPRCVLRGENFEL